MTGDKATGVGLMVIGLALVFLGIWALWTIGNSTDLDGLLTEWPTLLLLLSLALWALFGGKLIAEGWHYANRKR